MIKNKRQILNELVKMIKYQYDVKKLKKTLENVRIQGIDLNSKVYRGRTLLHYAAKRNNKSIIRVLIKSGVNPNICDDDYNTPLHYAINMNNYIAIKELIKRGADINIPGEFDQTPLHTAVLVGNIDVVKMLLENGADASQVDEKNLTPLDYAKDEKDEEIIVFLEKIIGGKK